MIEPSATHTSLNEVRELIIVEGVDTNLLGIYAWKIEGVGVYVGKYTKKSRPLREYNKNVRRLLNGQPYRPQKPNGYRVIHRALAKAVQEGSNIELHILENCSAGNHNEREQHYIATLGSGNLNATK